MTNAGLRGSEYSAAPAPIVQSGPPTQGTNAYWYVSGTPVGAFTFTIDGHETTSLAADADTTTMADALSVAATGETGNVIPYPAYEAYTLSGDGETYFLFVGRLGAQPVAAFTCSDVGVTVGGDDRTGVLPDPVGSLGQVLVDVAEPTVYQYAPSAGTQVSESGWQVVAPPNTLTHEGTDAEVEVVADGSVYIRARQVDGPGLLTAQYLPSFGKYYLTAFDIAGNETFDWSIGGSEHAMYFYGGGPTPIGALLIVNGGIAIGNGTDTVLHLVGAVDPSAGAGVAADTGSTYERTDGTSWKKTGAGDTAWQQLAFV